jgi:hydrogenase nickel incorporation protein HypA/HybF
MHEFSIIDGIIDIVTKTAADNKLVRVTAVNLRIGAMRQVVPDTLTMAFEITSKGTLSEGAKLSIEHVPIRATCKDCNAEFEVAKHAFACPACGSGRLKVTQGQELEITSIEGDDAEAATT